MDALWLSLPAALREEIDDLLCRHQRFKALTAYLERSSQPCPGIALAQNLIFDRQEVLYNQGRIPPEPETTVEEILDKAASLDAAPMAIEACWDGDSTGWITYLVAVVPGSGSRFDEVGLVGFHHRRAIGATPAEEALMKGQTVADRLGVPFYFADPDHPDLDHPRWWDTLEG